MTLGSPSVDKITLEKLQVAAQAALTEELVNAAKFDLLPGYMVGMLEARLRGYIWAEKLVDDVYDYTYRTPHSVWQMWKERHAPGWFLRRWPVRYDTHVEQVRFERYATYPGARLTVPDKMGTAVLYERTSSLGNGFTVTDEDYR